MAVRTAFDRSLDSPDSVGLQAAFLVLWTIDVVAASLFFVVSYASELNPVTVLFYSHLGLPGVVLAALCYAAIVVAIGAVLSAPMDVRFVGLMVALYLAFAVNNVFLLAFREPLPRFLGL